MNDIDPFFTNTDIEYLYNSEKTLCRRLFLIFTLISCILILIPVFLLIIIVDIWRKIKK